MMSTAEEQLIQMAMVIFSIPQLTDAEKSLLRAAASGKLAYCGECEEEDTEEGNNPIHSDAWGNERTIRAEIIRWLCVHPQAKALINPNGLRVKLARIDGKLNLSSVTIPFPLVLLQCGIPKSIDVSYAKTSFLNFEGCSTTSLKGNGLEVNGDLFLRKGFQAKGLVELNRAKLTGRLDCTGGRFLNAGGEALSADSITVGRDILLRHQFRAEGCIWLVGATITGYLDCTDGMFYHPEGIALAADGITVRDVHLRYHFQAEGLVHFASSKISGNMDLRQAQFRGKPPYNGLVIENAEITKTFNWREINKTDDTILDLWSTSVGQLADDESSWPRENKIDLEGFTYTTISAGSMDATIRHRWLERQTTTWLDPVEERELKWLPLRRPFSPQPYQQLAKVLRESGQETEAKQILIRKERARRKRGNLGWRGWCWNVFLDITMAHGYQPQRLLIVALVVVVMGWKLFALGYKTGVMIPTKAEAYSVYEEMGQVPPYYPAFRPLMYSLDTFLPVVNFGQKDYWWPRNTNVPPPVPQQVNITLISDTTRSLSPQPANRIWLRSDKFFCIYRWFHIVAGWLLITLGIAGITGFVRKD